MSSFCRTWKPAKKGLNCFNCQCCCAFSSLNPPSSLSVWPVETSFPTYPHRASLPLTHTRFLSICLTICDCHFLFSFWHAHTYTHLCPLWVLFGALLSFPVRRHCEAAAPEGERGQFNPPPITPSPFPSSSRPVCLSLPLSLLSLLTCLSRWCLPPLLPLLGSASTLTV